MQHMLVEDHIHELQHEAAALRAERRRDEHRRETAPPRGTGSGPRGRVGQWLIVVGRAIAGRPADEGCGDAGDVVAHAA